MSLIWNLRTENLHVRISLHSNNELDDLLNIRKLTVSGTIDDTPAEVIRDKTNEREKQSSQQNFILDRQSRCPNYVPNRWMPDLNAERTLANFEHLTFPSQQASRMPSLHLS